MRDFLALVLKLTRYLLALVIAVVLVWGLARLTIASYDAVSEQPGAPRDFAILAATLGGLGALVFFLRRGNARVLEAGVPLPAAAQAGLHDEKI
ncbi:MAG TPA: hypothetical protein VK843_08890 [Planctomycetota bacterium]|nr:hypothetical protein [Planctomycetota bacterium]